MVKLLVDCHSFDFDFSQGITSYIEGIYKILPSINKSVEFYFVAKDVEKIRKKFGESSNIHYLRLKSKNRLYRLVREIPALIKANNIDWAHFQYISPIKKNCKTIVTLHDILFLDYPQYFPSSYRYSKNLPFKISAKRADILCTVSEYSRERISTHYSIPQEKIYITPNGVSEEFYHISDDKPASFPEKYILYVSRIEPRKNHIAVLESFLRLNLADAGYKLVFIGRETVPTSDLHKGLSRLSISESKSVVLIPQANFEELKLWYKHANLFVYPSLAEGFGIPPIEAAAAGVPVISHNATAMDDFTFLGDHLIDINSTDILDDRIMKVLNQPTATSTGNISEFVKIKYDWYNIAKDFNRILNERF